MVYDAELTLNIAVPGDWQKVKVTQGEKTLDHTYNGDTLSVNAKCDDGTIIITPVK